MSKRSLILGIAGQDGSYLVEHLLELGHKVFGMVRRNSIVEHQQSRLDHIVSQIETFYGDVSDISSLESIIKRTQPDEIYNLAAMSHVGISFEIPHFTAVTNGIGVINVLECIRNLCPDTRMYQASSSEMFGNSCDLDGKQRENTPMYPVSPYGCAKLFGYNIVRNYRHSYKLFASNGILFNHESPRRGSNFVSNKIVKAAVQIKLGMEKEIALGTIDSARDWGHSYDYVRAMKLILDHKEADDFVVATGEARTVRDFCRIAFEKLGLDYMDYLKIDPKYTRPEEARHLCGDSTKCRTTLGWKPSYSFDRMVEEMIEYWLQVLS